ncbi:hypothetical protein [Photobacterium sp. TY1-4]|uniref:DoxX family protein n=1 Tax=Photobacterium sp. TY1-4 TaxID=2899122 RepID=UPI0021C24006|nr:hypothetical protein [Photobacterium sp. TY1-4]UXI00005.1 hypothetical protein NH461_09155 [Photobacterium sp. TY1-4]
MITPIIILLLLTGPMLIAGLLGRRQRQHPAQSSAQSLALARQQQAFWGLSLAFIFFAIGHGVETQGMVAMLPPWLPVRLELVYATGLLELVIAAGLLIPRFRIRTAQLAIGVFVIFFPANIYAAMHQVGLGGHQWGPVYLLLRAPLQCILIAWAYYFCLKPIPVREQRKHSY